MAVFVTNHGFMRVFMNKILPFSYYLDISKKNLIKAKSKLVEKYQNADTKSMWEYEHSMQETM